MNNIDTSWLNWDWIIANKEWLFSGVGLSVIGILFSALGFAFVLYRMRRQRGQTTNITQNTNDNATSGPIHTGQGDINITNYQGISPERHEQLSKELGITESALNNFFGIIKKKQIPLEDLDNTLREIAKHYKELLAKVNTLNPDDPEVAKLIEQAKQALENGDFDQAEQLFNQASELDIEAAKQAQEIANKRLVSAAESLAANGELKMTQLAYREAGKYYERAAKLLPVGNDEILADYLFWAGYAFYPAALYDKAKPLYERSLAIREKVFGKDHPDVATILNNLALLYKTQGEYKQAKSLCERSLTIDEKVHGKEHPHVATNLNNLAKLHKAQGNYDQARRLYERSLAIYEKVYGKEHPLVAISFSNLAELHKTQGNYNQAKPLYERSLAIREKIFGDEHPDVATCLNGLAGLYYFQGNYDQAKPLYERSLAICEKVFGDEHPDIATNLNGLALLYKTQGNYDKAMPLCERALVIYEKVYGPEHPYVATNFNNLALLYHSQGKYEQAKPLYERALAIDEKVYGPNHPDVATDLNNLALLHYNQGNYDQAKPLYERALKILNKFFDADHPLVRLYTENYNDLLSKMAKE